MIVYQLDLNWPVYVQVALKYFSAISSTQQYVFSFYCMYRQLGIDNGMSPFYFEVIKYGTMPIILSILAAFFWYLWGIYKRYKTGTEINYTLSLKVTVFVIIYLMYPTISNMSFSLINC